METADNMDTDYEFVTDLKGDYLFSDDGKKVLVKLKNEGKST